MYALGKGPLDYQLIAYKYEYFLTGDRSVDVPAILNEVIRLGEEMIREAPEQWLGWFGLKNWWKRADEILKEKSKAEGQKKQPGSRPVKSSMASTNHMRHRRRPFRRASQL